MNLEILNSSYWEHFKFAQELAGYLDLDHPKRIKIEKEINLILDKIRLLNSAKQDERENRRVNLAS